MVLDQQQKDGCMPMLHQLKGSWQFENQIEQILQLQTYILCIPFIFGHLFNKNDDISFDPLRNFVRSVLDRDNCSRFQILRARGPGKFLSLRTTRLQVWENDRNFRKSALSERVALFFRPCRGLTHPDECFRPQAAGKIKNKLVVIGKHMTVTN